MMFPCPAPRGAALLAAVWLVILAGCSPPPPTAEQRASQAARAACRQRADQVFAQQNRAAIFTQDRMDDPGSGGYQSGITTRGLADRFAWDNQVTDCVRNQGAAADAGPGLAPNPASVPASVPASAPATGAAPAR